MPLTALITRPEEDARPLAEALAARGVATVIEPLLAIRPLPEAASDLTKDLAGVQALLFTSANGARAFAELSPRRDIGVLAVGDATASAARGLGFTAVESAGGDVQGLARLVKQRLKPAGGPLLHAAGSAVAGDLAETLAADGFDLRRRMLYESATATALSPETIGALKQGRIDLVLLFSPRTAVTFAELARAAAVDASELTALCLSPAVATAVSGLAWKKVEVAEKPDLASLLALVDKRFAAPTSAAPTPGVASAAAGASSSTASSSGASTSVFPATPFTAASMESKSAPLGASIPDRSPPSAPGAPIPTIVPLPRRSGGSALLAGLIGAVIAAAAVVAVMRYAPEKMGLAPAGAAPAAVAPAPDLKPRLAELAARIEALQKQVSALPTTAPDRGDLPAKLATLQQQVAALQQAPAAGAPAALPAEITGLPQQVAAIDPKLGALDQRLGGLEQKLAGLPQGGGAAADLAPIKGQLDSLGQALKSDQAALADLAGLKSEVAKLEAASAGARTAAAAVGLVLGATELRARIAGGEPFTSELDSIAKLAAADPALSAAVAEPLATLKPLAGAGAPSLAQLQAEFPAVATAIVQAEGSAAGAAAGAAKASFWDRVLGRLESLVTIRPVAEGGEVAGNSTLDRLARAEDQLAHGNLPGAVAELSALNGTARDAAAPWIARAQARFATDAAAKKLAAALLVALAGSAGAAP
jgi:uroporphyrinogen-III synthase